VADHTYTYQFALTRELTEDEFNRIEDELTRVVEDALPDDNTFGKGLMD